MKMSKVKYRRLRIQRAVIRDLRKNTPAYYNARRLLKELYKDYFRLSRKPYSGPFQREFTWLTSVALSENSYWAVTKRK